MLHRMWKNHAMVVHVVHIVNINMYIILIDFFVLFIIIIYQFIFRNLINVHVRQHLKNDHQMVVAAVIVVVLHLDD